MSNIGKIFTMLCGLPGCGKSTWARRKLESSPKGTVVIVSSDDIREALWGDASDQREPDRVFNTMFMATVKSLKNEMIEQVVYDATNINAKKRAKLVKTLKRQFPNVHYHCEVVLAPIDTCMVRQSMRERKVPDEVIRRMAEQWHTPWYNEGWDTIGYNTDSLQDYCYLVEEFFNDMRGFEQCNKHHTLTLGEHCAAAAGSKWESQFAGRYDDSSAVSFAAALHDVGKLYTQSFDEYGEAHYYNHQNIGAYMVLCSDWFIKNYDSGVTIVDYVALLINWHMQPYFMNGETDAERGKNFLSWCRGRCFDKEVSNDLWSLHCADLEAH